VRSFAVRAAVGVAVTLSALSPTAIAARRPSRSESRAIVNAVKHSRLTRAVPTKEYNVVRIRISTAGHGWASAGILAKRASGTRCRPRGSPSAARGGAGG